MERSDLSPLRRGLARAAARARLAGAIIIAAALLVVPIVLWATFGDDELQHAVAVAIIATLLCWCFIHRLDGGHASGVDPAAQHGHHHRPAAGGWTRSARHARRGSPATSAAPRPVSWRAAPSAAATAEGGYRDCSAAWPSATVKRRS